MFENILSQPAVVARLQSEIANGTVPNVLLFEGAQYTGKLSTALELGRVLSCETDGRWNCPCVSCRQHRELVHADTLMLGDRYFLQEIRASADTMRSAGTTAGVYLFLRAVRKLLRRFDPVLWETDDNRLGKCATSIEAVEDSLTAFVPGDPLPDEARCEKLIDTVVQHSAKLVSALPREGIPVQMVRNLSGWARIAPHGRAKLAVLERVDRLQGGARNALLKTLEEPPHDVRFVLVTGNRGAVAETILSRARAYRFAERGPDEAREIMRRIFRVPEPGHGSLRAFFVGTGYPGQHSPAMLARRFLENVLVPQGLESYDSVRAIEQELRESGGEEWLQEFLRELLRALHGVLRQEEGGDSSGRTQEPPPIPLQQIERWNALVRRSLLYSDRLRLSIPAVIDSLYFSMRSG